MDFKKFLKWLSRAFGNFLLSLAVTLFIFSFFASAFFNNLDTLKNNLINELSTDESLSLLLNVDVKQVRELCDKNPNTEECKQLDSIKEQFSDNPEINNLINKIKSYSKYVFTLRLITLIFFVLGFLFIFLGSEFSLLRTMEKVSFSIAISSLLAVVYYKFFPKIFESVLNYPDIQGKLRDYPDVIVEKIEKIILDWLNLLINNVFKIAIILTVVFALVFIFLKVYERKKNKERI